MVSMDVVVVVHDDNDDDALKTMYHRQFFLTCNTSNHFIDFLFLLKKATGKALRYTSTHRELKH